MATQKQQKDNAMLTGLFSTKETEVLAALTEIHNDGNAAMVEPLLKTIVHWEGNEAVVSKARTILLELKTEAAVPALLSALKNPEFSDLKAFIISVFWHAGIYPVGQVDVLVREAISGDFHIALEALTVIENMDDAGDPDILQDALLDIDEYLDEHNDASHQHLLESIREVLKTKL